MALETCVKKLNRLVDRGELWTLSAARLLNFTGYESLTESTVWPRVFLRTHGPRLARDLRTWAAAGKAWSDLGRDKEAVKWLSDWPSREGVEAWMLLPLAATLWVLGRRKEAALVSRHAVELPADGSTGQHALWVALDEALAGRSDESGRWLTRADTAELVGFYQRLRDLLAALVIDGPELGYAAARRRLRQAYRPSGDADQLLRRLYHRCQQQLARQHYRYLWLGWHWSQALEL
jgi:hypothetical protein